MAAVPATALTFGSFTVSRPDAASVPRRRVVMVCRWVRDPATGGLVCVWEPDPEPRRRPIRHLRLVRA
jgi:hypothetical protein